MRSGLIDWSITDPTSYPLILRCQRCLSDRSLGTITVPLWLNQDSDVITDLAGVIIIRFINQE